VRSSLKKPLALVIPVFAAMAVAAGPASAAKPTSDSTDPCPSNKQLVAETLQKHDVDLNGDGLVCAKVHGNNLHGAAKDNLIVVTVP
jgi:hypothetical protein